MAAAIAARQISKAKIPEYARKVLTDPPVFSIAGIFAFGVYAVHHYERQNLEERKLELQKQTVEFQKQTAEFQKQTVELRREKMERQERQHRENLNLNRENLNLNRENLNLNREKLGVILEAAKILASRMSTVLMTTRSRLLTTV